VKRIGNKGGLRRLGGQGGFVEFIIHEGLVKPAPARTQAAPKGAVPTAVLTTDPRRLAAVQALLQFQTRVPAEGLPAYGADRLSAELELFPVWCVQHTFGRRWDAAEQALWARVGTQLVGSAQAQPRIAVRGGWSVADAGAALEATGAVAGPITCDIAALLRDGGVAEDEGAELDLAIRWWDGARRAGLPVDADFGECWRALEWMGLQRHLMLLGQACRDRQGGADEAHTARLAPLLAAASKVALRYAPLKPLLRLLLPLQGQTVGAGYTF
jgi:aminoglycoside/choline kinase family phosphotransferase